VDTIAYIGLGGTEGDRLAALAEALRRLAASPHVVIGGVSAAIESEPAGVADQPRFANAVARVLTDLTAEDLLGLVQEIETAMGRPSPEERAGSPAAPRVIDLDLLLFGDEERPTTRLTLPHPRMRERAFVMGPLADIGPDASWPDGSPVTRSDVEAATEGPVVAVLGPIPGFEDLTVSGGQEGWVSLAMLPRFRVERRPDMDLLFAETVLRDSGIPYHWDPQPPTGGFNPWGVGPTIRLLVPAGYAERAAAVLAEAESAPIEWPEGDAGE
jgi:2-amino-4-hydroxy-6-hydroxymethyldihydropteridine diphosphokinase